MKPGIGFLVGVLSVATLMAVPASAARHRHHRNHHPGSGIVCGVGTANVGGVCTPTTPAGPIGNANFVITPSDITMNLDGSFAASLTLSGLPPFIFINGFATSLSAACTGVTAFSTTGGTDALGRNQGVLSGIGCVPGTYPLTLFEGTAPFQTFTGFLTLHF